MKTLILIFRIPRMIHKTYGLRVQEILQVFATKGIDNHCLNSVNSRKNPKNTIRPS